MSMLRMTSGSTPLHNAVEGASEILLAHGADVNAKSDSGYTPLHGAARDAAFERVKVLLEHGADVNAKNSYGSTPLDLAHVKVWWHRRATVKVLLEYGAKDD